MIANFFLDAQQDTQLKKVAQSSGGEWAGPCPFCGGNDRFHVQPSKSRWLCRGCTQGKWKSPWEYYQRRDGRQPDQITVYPKREEKPKVYSWQADPERYVCQYEQHPQRFELWQNHKPVSVETITTNRLGVGILPSCSCHHARLIVPILDGSMVVGLRGRRLACQCDKWMPAAGSPLSILPLFNAKALSESRIVWLVENCVDALLGTQNTGYAFLAIYSTSYWRDAWEETIRSADPELVVVALDNDLVGNGGAQRRNEMIAAYKKANPQRPVPEPAGPKIAGRLEKILRGRITLWDWKDAAPKADIGSLLSQGAMA